MGTCKSREGKARKSIHISLNAIAVKVLRKQIGKHPERVFTYRGKPIIQVNTRVWRKTIRNRSAVIRNETTRFDHSAGTL